jgi:hypothetical protein
MRNAHARTPRRCGRSNPRPRIDTVILISRYVVYVKGSIENRFAATTGQGCIVDVPGEDLNPQAAAALFERQLGVTVSRLLAAGKTVVLVYPVPEIGFVVPSAVGRLIARGGDPRSLNLPLASFMQGQDVVLSALDHAGTSERIVRVYPLGGSATLRIAWSMRRGIRSIAMTII